jgi:hypothetical protein
MGWQDEPFTLDFLALSYEARSLVVYLARYVDRDGILEVGKLGLRGIAIVARAPWPTIEPFVMELLRDGQIVLDGARGEVLIPNHYEAQGALLNSVMERRRERSKGDRLRDEVIARDGLLCRICGGDVAPEAVHVDHIKPVARGGRSTLSNLRVTHAVCNRRKGARLEAPDEGGSGS